MVRAEGPFPDRQRTLAEKFGLRIVALSDVEHDQVVQTLSHIWMVHSCVPFGQFQCLSGDDNGTIVLSLLIQRHHLLVEGIPFHACASCKRLGGCQAKHYDYCSCLYELNNRYLFSGRLAGDYRVSIHYWSFTNNNSAYSR